MSHTVRIFEPSVPEGFQWALPTDPDDFDVIVSWLAQETSHPWQPVHMSLITEDDNGRNDRWAYMPWFGRRTLILRDEAIDIIGPLLQPHGEVLPLLCDEARLSLFAAPVLAGVLDEDRSEIVRFGSGRIMKLTDPLFHVDTLGDVQAFAIAEMPRGALYLQEELVERMNTTGLTAGTTFQIVYDEARHAI